MPYIKSKGHKPAVPAHFDTALIIENIQAYHSQGGIASIHILLNGFTY